MTEGGIEASDSNSEFSRVLRSPNLGLSAGVICAVFSAILILYAADYIFLRIPELSLIQGVARIRLRWPYPYIVSHGWVLWMGMALLSALSLHYAFKNRTRRGYVAFNVYVLIGSAGFALVARNAVWSSWLSLFQDFA